MTKSVKLAVGALVLVSAAVILTFLLRRHLNPPMTDSLCEDRCHAEGFHHSNVIDNICICGVWEENEGR
jgi:hypothetical protein